MKTLKIPFTILCLLIIVSCSKSKKTESNETTARTAENISKKSLSATTATTTGITYTTFSSLPSGRQAKYSQVLQVVDGTGESNFDVVNSKINLKTPVGTNSFSNYGTYDISSPGNKAILYIIDNGTNTSNPALNYLLQDSIDFSSVTTSGGSFSLAPSEKLVVGVLHENMSGYSPRQVQSLLTEARNYVQRHGSIPCGPLGIQFRLFDATKDSNQKGLTQPKTACGGVITDI